MADDNRIYDGHTFLFGMDGDTEPSALQATVASKAINRTFRGGRNKTRPPLVHRQWVEDEEFKRYEHIIRFGNIQGGFMYRKKKPGRCDGLILSIAGSIFHFTLVNERMKVKFICNGNDAKLLHCWMEQVEEWLYIQDGNDLPWFWDGQYPSSARRSRGTPGNEMPIGTIMKYIFGRMFVSNAFDQIAASDIIYGNGFTSSTNTQKFTENTYWSEGGYFGLPTNLGHITGMIAMQAQGRGNLYGQGQLLVTSIDGAQSILASIPRGLWKDQQVQGIEFLGRGGVSPYAIVNVNNDVFFRSDDGLSSYRLTVTEQNALSLTRISRAVNNWYSQDTQDYLQYCSAIYFDNRVLCTVSPFLEKPSDSAFGSHRYHRGIIAYDLDRPSNNPGDGDTNFDGLWTGTRPVVLLNGVINGVKRAFSVSHDDDGQNRIYEIMRQQGNDSAEGVTVQTKWSYSTKRFTWIASGKTNEFETKRLIGGEVWVSDVHDRITISASYRPDYAPNWKTFMEERQFGSAPTTYKFSQPRYRRFKIGTPKDDCVGGLPYKFNHGTGFQFRVEGYGMVEVPRFRAAIAPNDPNAPTPDCADESQEIVLDVTPEDDYVYSIIGSR